MSNQIRRDRTERKIVNALRKQLATQGFRAIGVNTIARRAGVSKALIYRYFGSIESLLKIMMKEQDYWPSVGRHAEETNQNSAEERIHQMLVKQISTLRGNNVLRAIRSWELLDKNELTGELAKARETASLEFLKDCDIAAEDSAVPQIALMLAGVLYLSIRSNTADSFMGISLKSEAGWHRLEDAIEKMTTGLFKGEVTKDTRTPTFLHGTTSRRE